MTAAAARLAAIRARLDATSPGVWTATTSYPYLVLQGKPGSPAEEADGIISTSLATDRHEGADGEFIARAHDEDVPWLLAEVSRLAAELDQARARITTLEAEVATSAAAARRDAAALAVMGETVRAANTQRDQARATVLREALAAVADRTLRAAASGGDWLGWESAYEVLANMLRDTAPNDTEETPK